MKVLTTLRVCLLFCLPVLTACAGGSSGDVASSAQNDNGVTVSAAQAAVQIAWDATDPSAHGYYVHYGTQSPNTPGSCAYPEQVYYSLASLGSPSSPTVTITGLTSGQTYYFAVSASSDDVEGTCSNEIWKPM